MPPPPVVGSVEGVALLEEDELLLDALVVAAATALTVLDVLLLEEVERALLDVLLLLEVVGASVVATVVVRTVEDAVVVDPAELVVATTDALPEVDPLVLRLLDVDPVSVLPELDDVEVVAAWPLGAASATGTAMARPSAPASTARSTLPTLALNVSMTSRRLLTYYLFPYTRTRFGATPRVTSREAQHILCRA
jgi:hypothetical protein